MIPPYTAGRAMDYGTCRSGANASRIRRPSRRTIAPCVGTGRPAGGMAPLTLAQDVADSAYGLDQARFTARLRLGAQVTDVDVEYVVVAAEIITPYRFQDALARQHLPWVSEEEGKKVELLRT